MKTHFDNIGIYSCELLHAGGFSVAHADSQAVDRPRTSDQIHRTKYSVVIHAITLCKKSEADNAAVKKYRESARPASHQCKMSKILQHINHMK